MDVARCATGADTNTTILGLCRMMDEVNEGLPPLTDEELGNPYTRISFRGFEIQLWQVAHLYGVNHDMPDTEWRAGASSSDFRAMYSRQYHEDVAFSDLQAGVAIGHVTEKRPLPESPSLPSSILASREHLYPRTQRHGDYDLDTHGLIRLIDELVDEAWSDETDEEETEHAIAASEAAQFGTPFLCPPPLYADTSFPPPSNPPPNRPLPSLPQRPRSDRPPGNKHEAPSALLLPPNTSHSLRTTESFTYSQPDRDSESSSQRTITPRASRRQLAAKPAPRGQDVSTSAPSQRLVALPPMQEAPMPASAEQLLTIRTALREGPVPAASGHLATRSKEFHDTPTMPEKPSQQPAAAPRMREVPMRTTSRQQLVAAPQVQEAPMRKGYDQQPVNTWAQIATIPPPPRQRLVTASKEIQGAPVPAASVQQPTATPRVRDVSMRKASEQQLVTPRERQETPVHAAPEDQLLTIRRVLREGPTPAVSIQQHAAAPRVKGVPMREGADQQLFTTPQVRKMTASERQLVTMSRMLREGPMTVEPDQLVPPPRARDATLPTMPRQQLIPTPQVAEPRAPTLLGQQPLPRVRDAPVRKAYQQQLEIPPRAREVTVPATSRQHQPQVAMTQQMRQVTMPTASGQQPMFTPRQRDVSMPTARAELERPAITRTVGRTGPPPISRRYGEVSMPTSGTMIERPPIALRTERSAPASVLHGYSQQVSSMPTSRRPTERPPIPQPTERADPASTFGGYGEQVSSIPTARRPAERPPISQSTGRAPPTSILRNHGEDSYRGPIGDSFGRRRQDSGLSETRPKLPPALSQQLLPDFLRNPPSFLQYPPDFSQQPPQNQQPGAAMGYPQLNKSKSSANVSSTVTRPVTPTAEDGTALTSRWSPDSSPEESRMRKVRKALSFAKLRPPKSKVFRQEAENEANEATAPVGQRTSASSGSGRSSSGKTGKPGK